MCSSIATQSHSPRNIEIFVTLPKRMLRKSTWALVLLLSIHRHFVGQNAKWNSKDGLQVTMVTESRPLPRPSTPIYAPTALIYTFLRSFTDLPPSVRERTMLAPIVGTGPTGPRLTTPLHPVGKRDDDASTPHTSPALFPWIPLPCAALAVREELRRIPYSESYDRTHLTRLIGTNPGLNKASDP